MSNTPRTDAIWLQWFGEPVDAMENEVAIRKWLYDPLCKIERDLAAANADAERWREHQRLTWATEKEAGAYEAAIDAAIAAREKP